MLVAAVLLLQLTSCIAQATTESVTTPEAFQAAVMKGVKHIVISEHLDTTGLSKPVKDSVATNLVAFVGLSGNVGTATIRVCC
jgi:hypothetical protein